MTAAVDDETRAIQQSVAQQARRILFGNINDSSSKVAKIKAQQRNYGVLADLNTRPRTSYIAEVFNPNPKLAEARTEHAPAKS